MTNALSSSFLTDSSKDVCFDSVPITTCNMRQYLQPNQFAQVVQLLHDWHIHTYIFCVSRYSLKSMNEIQGDCCGGTGIKSPE